MTDKPAKERPLWSLNRDEQRLLWITFVGGLASILVGAGVIGAAIALGRPLAADPEPLKRTGAWLTAVLLALFVLYLSMVRRSRSFLSRIVLGAVLVVLGLCLLFFGLLWLGVAAGVK
jgi:xanthine/uracil permease